MKCLKLLPIFGALLTTAACSGSGGGGGNTAGDRNIATASHKVEECPQINGDYVQNGGESRKTIKSEKTSSGLNFDDTDVKWIIDGATHSAEGGPQLSYRGSCEGYSIVLDLYQGSNQLGRMTYSWNSKAQLVIETTVIDPRMGQSGKEVWEPKNP